MDTRDPETSNEDEEEEKEAVTDEIPETSSKKGIPNHDLHPPVESEWESQSQTQPQPINSSHHSRTPSPSQEEEEPTSVPLPTRDARPYFLHLNTLISLPTSFLQPPTPYSALRTRSPQPYTKILSEKYIMSPTPPQTSSSRQEAEQCNICLESLNNPSTVQPCGHRYHYACIENWLRTQYTERGRSRIDCPLCRGVVEGIRTFNPDRVLSITDIFEHEREGSRRPPRLGESVRGGSRDEQRRRSLALMRDGSRHLGRWEREGSEAPREYYDAYDSEREHGYDYDYESERREYVMGMDGDLVEWRDRRGEQREREYRNRREHNRRRERSRIPAPSGNRTPTNEQIASHARIALEELHRAEGLVRSRQLDRDNAERLYLAALREEQRAVAQVYSAEREEEESALNFMSEMHHYVVGAERELVEAERLLREAQYFLLNVRRNIHGFNVNGIVPLSEDLSSLEEVDFERFRQGDGRRNPGFDQRLLEAPARAGLLESSVNGTRDYANRRDNRGRPSRPPNRTNSEHYPRTRSATPQRRGHSERSRSRPPDNRNTGNSPESPRSRSRPPQVSPTQRQDSRDQNLRQQTRNHWSNVSFEQGRGAHDAARSTSTSQGSGSRGERRESSRTYSNDNGEGSSSGFSSRRTGNRDDHRSGVPEQWLEEDRLSRLNLNVTKY